MEKDTRVPDKAYSEKYPVLHLLFLIVIPKIMEKEGRGGGVAANSHYIGNRE